MYRKISLLVYVCAIFSLYSTAYSVEMPVGSESITLLPMNLSVLGTGDVDTIEKEAYPSGMLLPTKYLDILDFVPYTGDIEDSVTVDFLNRYWPECKGEFTYAEYMAARRFCCYASHVMLDGDSLATALLKCYDTYGWSITTHMTAVSLKSSERFNSAIQYFAPLLQDASVATDTISTHELYPYLTQVRTEGFAFSIGEGVPYVSLCSEEPVDPSELAILPLTVLSYPSMLSFFDAGLVQLGVNTSVAEGHIQIVDDFGTDISPIAEPSSTIDEEDPDDPSSVLGPSLTVQLPRSPGDPLLAVGEAIQELHYSVLPPTKLYGLYDIVGVICLIFTVIGVGVLAIVRFFTDYNDPTNSWKRRR